MPKNIDQRIKELVDYYKSNIHNFEYITETARNAFLSDPSLSSLIHSSKSRVKNPSHLKGKLIRKAKEAINEGKEFEITKSNLFHEITDLAGVRLLHLHTRQMGQIDTLIKEIAKSRNFDLVKGPVANTWDDEYRSFFEKLGIKTRQRENVMYTSVHYIFASNSVAQERVELQVRTLMEEVWGEVDHQLNYPKKTKSLACAEQLKVLARVTSSATRLVDSIYLTIDDHINSKKKIGKKRK